VPVQKMTTANSKTRIAYDSDWLVLDIGSGHKPHPRANILVDRYLEDDLERSGQKSVLPENVPFIIADATALPFKKKAFDFIICSHVAEHIDAPYLDQFCSELNRVGKAGYIETPSVFAEYLRHSNVHRWFVSKRENTLIFRPILSHDMLGWFGKLARSFFFYDTTHAYGYQSVFGFARGIPKPFHYLLILFRYGLYTFWIIFKSVFYMRFFWKDRFSWEVAKSE
jgi:hypothetical protein